MLKAIFSLNEQGKRKNLEDCIFPSMGAATKNDKLFMVCDGVGGLSKGEEASRIVCKTISEHFSEISNKPFTGKFEEVIAKTIKEMKVYAELHPEAEKMSTTLTLAYIQDHKIFTAWCGDSRIYHIRNGKILWQSKDHSLVQQLVDLGEITKEEASSHPQKNIILRSVGPANHTTQIDTHSIVDIIDGDYLLLCTDGILENVSDVAIADILGDKQIEADKKKLFLDYCMQKTNDNYSMYLLQLDKKAAPVKEKSKYSMLILIAFVLVGIGALFAYQLNQKENKMQEADQMQTILPNSQELETDSSMLKMLENQIGKDSVPVNQ